MHADSRSSEDFDKMFISGIDTAITCSYYPYKLNNNPDVLINHFDRILNFEPKRAGEYGLDLKVALGIHPTNAISNSEAVFQKLEELIENKEIIAIGEIGLDENTSEEQKLFKKQLELADETKSKVIIHTPRKNKAEVLKDIKITIGLTVQPQKMEVSEAVDIMDQYGFDKFLLNSDISNKPSDPLSVPRTVRTLKRLGYNEKDIEKVSHRNAEKFFDI